jgi:hypothetical protein
LSLGGGIEEEEEEVDLLWQGINFDRFSLRFNDKTGFFIYTFDDVVAVGMHKTVRKTHL